MSIFKSQNLPNVTNLICKPRFPSLKFTFGLLLPTKIRANKCFGILYVNQTLVLCIDNSISLSATGSEWFYVSKSIRTVKHATCKCNVHVSRKELQKIHEKKHWIACISARAGCNRVKGNGWTVMSVSWGFLDVATLTVHPLCMYVRWKNAWN